MRRWPLIALFAAATCAHAAKAPLEIQPITSSLEGFSVVSTLITGKKSAVLIDAGFLLSDAQKIVEAVRASKKELRTVYITHYHPDHYFGLAAIKKAFPRAKFVAQPTTLRLINETWQAKVEQWKPSYAENIPDDPVRPEAMFGAAIMLDGQTLEIHSGVQGDSKDNSFIWIPSIKTVIAGDTVYNGVFPWTAETQSEDRLAWAQTIDRIAALKPEKVIAGHKKPDLPDSPASLAFMKEYLEFYEKALANAQTSDDFQRRVMTKYPDLALDVMLKIAADGAFTAKTH